MIREIKQRICEFVHERNGSKASCKNQIESCLQLIRLCDVARIMNQVESEYETKTDWIPCEVDMPKELGRYIVTLKDGRSLEAIYDNISKRFIMYEHEVIAWQPLPAPYKKEGAE